MNPKDYEKNVLITESTDFYSIRNRIDDKIIRLLHAGLGFSSELEELINATNDPKDGKLDWVNIAEEGGDIAYYCAVAVNALEFDPNEVSSGESGNEDVVIKNSRDDLLGITAALTWSVGKYSDLLKKHLVYGKPLKIEDLKSSLRAICACVSGLSLVCGTTIEQVRATNIAKLKARYGDKFTEAAALNRDLDTERKILEEGVK